ncbi:MAG TPA: DNA polymerase domain-containing protein, partial [Nitrososphaeraceae archaeon]
LLYVQIQSTRYYQPFLKKIGEDSRVKQLFNADLSRIQQYLFTKLRIEPTSMVKVEHSGSKILQISKIDDDEEPGEVSPSPPPFSLLYFDLHTFSGILASDDGIRLIKVRYETGEKKKREEDILFQNSEEKAILQEFSNYVHDKDPDIIICMGDYGNNTILHYLFARAKKIGFNLQLGREIVDNDDFDTSKILLTRRIKGRICISSSYRHSTYFDQFGLAGLIERARFGFLPLGMAARYSINRLIDSRNCYELIQRGFVIPNNNSTGISNNNNNNHEHIRTIEQIVSRDKGGMIISPQIGMHENVVAIDYDSEYANLIVNHNLSHETVTLEEGGKRVAVQKQDQQSNKQKGLLPTIVERFLKRRLYFKRMLKHLPKESMEYVWCDQRVNSLKNILVSLYGSTGSLWNRYGNVLAFEEINKLSRDILIRTKDIVQESGYELVYADTDSVFIKKKGYCTARDYQQLIDTLSKETGLPISIDCHYKFLVLLPLEADEKIEVLKHYFGITHEDELVVRGIEIRRHDTPNFIKQFQTQLLYTLFDCKDSSEVISKGYEDALLLVTQTIDKIMTGEDIQQQDLVISKLLRQDIAKYKSLFPHVSAAIQLSNHTGKHPIKGDTIQYIYTNSQHNNPLCRVVPIAIGNAQAESLSQYNKEKYKEMILDAAETVLGFLGFDRTVYSSNIKKKKGRRKWYDELREEPTRDIQTETME